LKAQAGQRHAAHAFEIAAHEAIAPSAELERGGAGRLDAGAAVLAEQRQHALDAPHGGRTVLAMDRVAKPGDLVRGVASAVTTGRINAVVGLPRVLESMDDGSTREIVFSDQ